MPYWDASVSLYRAAKQTDVVVLVCSSVSSLPGSPCECPKSSIGMQCRHGKRCDMLHR